MSLQIGNIDYVIMYMLDLIRKITKEPLSEVKTTHNGRTEIYRLNEMFAFDRNRMASNQKVFDVVAMICAYGVQPITGFVSRNANMYNVLFDGLGSLGEIVDSMIERQYIDNDTNVMINGYKPRHLTAVLTNHLMNANAIRIVSSAYWQKRATVAIVNQRYVSNSNFASFFNAMLFNEFTWYMNLKILDQNEAKVAQTLMRRHGSLKYEPLTDLAIHEEVAKNIFNLKNNIKRNRINFKLEKTINEGIDSFGKINEYVELNNRFYDLLSVMKPKGRDNKMGLIKKNNKGESDNE